MFNIHTKSCGSVSHFSPKNLTPIKKGYKLKEQHNNKSSTRTSLTEKQNFKLCFSKQYCSLLTFLSDELTEVFAGEVTED